ncbi:hypothetical protein JXL21_10000, partial [Candidatus Bathyarchaeota archaeon]|nr:hypothetical protein [Candidatus Bathyarchaeota archaeon]
MDKLQKFLCVVSLLLLLAVASSRSEHVEAQAEVTVVSSHVSKTRTAVNEMVSVGFRLVWTESGDPLPSASVTVNGETFEIFQDGWVIFYDTSSYVRKITWGVDSVRVDGTYRSFEVETENPSCVFDRVVVELQSDDTRIGVGETPEVVYEAYYDYDDTTFRGTVSLNDTVTSAVVGSGKIGVLSVDDDKYGIKEYTANKVRVIWDRVNVQLFSTRHRYDVGEEPELTYIAYYEYDKASFEGDLGLTSSATIYTVGKQDVTVSSVRDDEYDVGSFVSNTVELIFDQVVIELAIPDTRINVGEEAEVYWSAH